jgi:hypothetical protein
MGTEWLDMGLEHGSTVAFFFETDIRVGEVWQLFSFLLLESSQVYSHSPAAAFGVANLAGLLEIPNSQFWPIETA